MSGEHYFIGDEIAIKIDDELWDMADIRPEDLLVIVTGITVTPNDSGLEDVKPTVEIKARNTYIGPEEEDESDQASDPENGLPVAEDGDGSVLVRSFRKRMQLGGWGGSRP